jgi:hypothetical protein
MEKASAKGFTTVAVTDRAIPNCRVARVRKDGPTWVFDLEGATEATIAGNGRPAPPRRRRR